ncbi:DUF4384 domain-containing protein [Maridesulfovibrio salexigens]|uniref:DUF4384 domain-containing protein n=1 Tax=Maridesulfovibrio salexigens (strain ATCC 14822 / DSM 2638 / NCIMB 8403 / VKM B-1763) TaxID=526222 RepID=C6BZN7_MARSD|nr:DUF4384 domain-containing protein [Maridesulfovibrio salexigens]ACS78944.1 conserved hypothetical protein [Maridesulfovibrio salexigens DSM 2638]
MKETMQLFLLGIICFCLALPSLAGGRQISKSSVLIESEGMACLGLDRTRTQVRKLALDDARRSAAERVSTYVSRETSVDKGKVSKDLIDVYSRATVKVIEELEKGWLQSKDKSGYLDQCYKIKIKAEIIPAESNAESRLHQQVINNPRAPLTVELWTDKDTYKLGDFMKFYFRGNKPFYAHAVYEDAEGNLIEVTPSNRPAYYRGGVIYEIPGQNDRFTLQITPPLGKEKLILYTATSPMGSYQGKMSGDFLIIDNDINDIGMKTRGLAVLKGSKSMKKSAKAEFAEAQVNVLVEK